MFPCDRLRDKASDRCLIYEGHAGQHWRGTRVPLEVLLSDSLLHRPRHQVGIIKT